VRTLPDANRLNDATLSKELDNVANIVGAHPQIRVLRTSPAFDRRRLERFGKRPNHRGAMRKTNPSVVVPDNVGRFRRNRGGLSVVDLLKALPAEPRGPIDTATKRVIIQTGDQSLGAELADHVPAAVERQAGSAGKLFGGSRLVEAAEYTSLILVTD